MSDAKKAVRLVADPLKVATGTKMAVKSLTPKMPEAPEQPRVRAALESEQARLANQRGRIAAAGRTGRQSLISGSQLGVKSTLG